MHISRTAFRCPQLMGLVIAASAMSSTLAQPARAETDYRVAAEAVSAAFKSHLFDPALLSDPQFETVERKTLELASHSKKRGDWVRGFNEIWKDGPVSHVSMSTSRQSADEVAAYLDTLRVGPKAVQLDFQGQVAILTINTMMGLDTIEAIDAAFDALQSRKPDALVVDLRANIGGAFAVRPLVGHLLQEDLDAGYFLSRSWFVRQQKLPSKSDITSLKPWDGWSIRTFWRDVQAQPVTRIRFVPLAPTFTGKVFILTSAKTASAAEMAVDALSGLPNVEVVGERTAGQMLSQKIFDLPFGLQLSLPIADYYSLRMGRIEGKGVPPTTAVLAAQALDVAIQRASMKAGE